ncbi:hypothetical protein RJ639_005878 [Escallonia herrerae]|uniref:Uncharacterized protein n=1 Tax=Escallonia herrerae TaxID=1293975 RepID=A0AA89AU65_9ASTE|nr:hypothetical protein RJ639_005878 [Escallonia herrerae]
MKLMNSDTHSWTVSLASLAIFPFAGSAFFMIRLMLAIGREIGRWRRDGQREDDFGSDSLWSFLIFTGPFVDWAEYTLCLEQKRHCFAANDDDDAGVADWVGHGAVGSIDAGNEDCGAAPGGAERGLGERHWRWLEKKTSDWPVVVRGWCDRCVVAMDGGDGQCVWRRCPSEFLGGGATFYLQLLLFEVGYNFIGIHLRQIHMVISESLSMSSTISFTCREAVVDVEYNGYLIPKKWKVVPLFRNIHHNPKFFIDPETFNPSRFEIMTTVACGLRGVRVAEYYGLRRVVYPQFRSGQNG